MLQLRGIRKRYGETTVLDNIDLDVQAGTTAVLLGPSGCGKSTLLRILLGLVAPDDGQVLIDGQPIAPAQWMPLRHRLGYVIQQGGLFPHVTARDNITLMARQLGWSPDRIRARMDTLLRLTHLPDATLDRYPRQISGGQYQRVSLMRALFLDPEALLLDEPLGALDPMIRRDLQEDLKAVFVDLGKAVVLVTHDLHEAAYFADHVVLLQAGRIVQQGSIQELLRTPAAPFVRQFIAAQRGSLSEVGE